MWPSFPFCPSCLVFRCICSWCHSLSPRPVRCVWSSPVLLLVFPRWVFLLVSFPFRRSPPFPAKLVCAWRPGVALPAPLAAVGACPILCFLFLAAFFLSSLCISRTSPLAPSPTGPPLALPFLFCPRPLFVEVPSSCYSVVPLLVLSQLRRFCRPLLLYVLVFLSRAGRLPPLFCLA